MINVLSDERGEGLVVLLIGLQWLAPCPKPQEEDEGGKPAKNLWATPNLIQSFDKH
jgi:hypothetical protein